VVVVGDQHLFDQGWMAEQQHAAQTQAHVGYVALLAGESFEQAQWVASELAHLAG
jgi:hypothetical protein